MNPNSMFRWFLIVVVSAVVHTLILLIVIGVPSPGMLWRGMDPEVVQFPVKPMHQLAAIPQPELKDTDVPALPPPTPAPKKVHHHAKIAKKTVIPVTKPAEAQPSEEAQAPAPKVETTEHKTKVIDVKFDDEETQTDAPATKPDAPTVKDDATATTDDTTATQDDDATDDKNLEKDQEQVQEPANAQPATAKPTDDNSASLTEPKPAELQPVQDKVAGVEAADTKSQSDNVTEAAAPEANPAPPAETEPASTVIDKTENPQDN